jgi:hypothetical protein
VQERADRLGLGSADLQHERGDREQVRDIGRLGALAQLTPVVAGGQQQRAVEGFAQQRGVREGLGHRA